MKTNRYLDLYRASRIPFFLFAIDVLLMPIEPWYWFADRYTLLGLELTTWRSLIVVLLAVPYILQKGWRKPLNPVAIGYTVVMLTTLFLATPLAKLTHMQSIRTYAFLLVAPLALYEIRHEARDIDFLLGLLSLAGLVNIAVGVLLFIAHLHSLIVVEYGTHALRLAGSGIPAALSETTLVALIASLLLYRRSRKYLILTGVNLVIIILTGTRGSAAGALVAIAGFFINEWRARGWKEARPILLATAISLVIGLAAYAPTYIIRFKPSQLEKTGLLAVTNDSDVQQLASVMNTSGRIRTWVFFWGLVKDNPWFGRGLGAGAIGDQLAEQLAAQHKILRVPHNEYLRFLVEGGIFGTVVMLVAYGLQFAALYHVTRKDYRLFLLALIFMYAALAVIENVVSGPAIASTLWTLLGLFRERELHEECPPAQKAQPA